MPDYIECSKKKTSIWESVGLGIGSTVFLMTAVGIFILTLMVRFWSIAGTVAGVIFFFLSPPGYPNMWAVFLVTGLLCFVLFSLIARLLSSKEFGNLCDRAEKKFGDRIKFDLVG